MNVKVKRGLGLLVVAVIAFLVALVLSSAWDAENPWRLVGQLAQLVAILTTLCAFVGGLVLLAWGLLRD